MTELARITIFYDGSCPLCRREIAHYLRRDRAGRLEARDIAADPAPLAAIGASRDAAMAALHVRDATGRVAIGAAAFLAIWDVLPRWHWLARGIRAVPGAVGLLERAYRFVAPRRARVAAALCPGERCAR